MIVNSGKLLFSGCTTRAWFVQGDAVDLVGAGFVAGNATPDGLLIGDGLVYAVVPNPVKKRIDKKYL